MRVPAVRVVALAAAGAAAAAICLVLLFQAHAAFTLEMDRELPRFVTGFHDIELAQDVSFAWTKRRARIALAGLDRRVPWACVVRLRGARSAPLPQPLVTIAVDGVTAASRTATNTYEDFAAVLAPTDRPGAILDLTSDPPFVPGPGDTRELGVQVDRLSCRPDALALPPRQALGAATLSGTVFGAAFALLGFSFTAGATAVAGLALAQALPLSSGPAPYSPYEGVASALAIWIAIVMVLTCAMLSRLSRGPLDAYARAVIALSGAVLFLQLLALLHPSKALVDAVFHAHRLEWVLGGRYFFTQPMPDGVRFPYAIGLYLFAAPWSSLTRDFVTLLRIVVCAWHAAAGALLFVVVSRTWGDRLAGVLAVALFHLVPVPFIVIGNANLTYAFAQSAAFIAVNAAIALPLGSRASDGSDRQRGRLVIAVQFLGLFAIASLAMLSHVGVFPVLFATLLILAALYWLLGGASMRAPAKVIFLAGVLAAVFSVVSYYGRFAEVYATLSRVTSASARAGQEPVAPAGGAGLAQRAANVGALFVTAMGWPMVVLAAAGLAVCWVRRVRDRLGLALTAALASYAIFVAVSVAAPVEPRFQRYTDEFIDRLNYATMPVVVVLSSWAATAGWRYGWVTRGAAGTLLMAAGVYGVRAWLAWFA